MKDNAPMTCITPNCKNPRDHNRRICTVCRNRQSGQAAKRSRARQRTTYGPCTSACPGWLECTTKRLWVAGPLPCETLLADEIGVEFEADGTASYWVIPLQVKVNLEAAG